MVIIRATNGHNYTVSDNDLASAMLEEETWAAEFRQALLDEAAYDELKHRDLAIEMNSIEARLGNYSGGTIFDYVRSIFDDILTRGFKHNLHFPQLLFQYRSYGFGEPPEQWVPPPDIQSRDASPVLPPAGTPTALNPTNSPTLIPTLCLQPLATSGFGTNSDQIVAGPSKEPTPSQFSTFGKVKKSNTSASEVNSNNRPDDIPAGATELRPGCSRCQGAGSQCWVLRRDTRKAACHECRKVKMKCNFRADDLANDQEAPRPKKKRRTDNNAPAAGSSKVKDPGQFCIHRTHQSQFLTSKQTLRRRYSSTRHREVSCGSSRRNLRSWWRLCKNSRSAVPPWNNASRANFSAFRKASSTKRR